MKAIKNVQNFFTKPDAKEMRSLFILMRPVMTSMVCSCHQFLRRRQVKRAFSFVFFPSTFYVHTFTSFENRIKKLSMFLSLYKMEMKKNENFILN